MGHISVLWVNFATFLNERKSKICSKLNELFSAYTYIYVCNSITMVDSLMLT